MFDEFIAEAAPDDSQASPQASPGAKPEKAALPDGIGLSMEEVHNLVLKHNKVGLGADDPILMLAPIHNAFLAENQKLLEHHRQALTKIMAEHTDGYVRSVKESVDGLAQEISGASAKELREVCNSHTEALAGFRRDLFWTAGIVAASAAANLIAMAVRVYG